MKIYGEQFEAFAQDNDHKDNFDESTIREGEYCGYLHLKKGMFNSWERLFFKLKGNLLYYYQAHNTNKVSGLIFLEQAVVQQVNDYGERKNCFEIKYVKAGLKGFIFSCETPELREEWMNTLKYSTLSYLIESLKESNKYTVYLKNKLDSARMRIKALERIIINSKLESYKDSRRKKCTTPLELFRFSVRRVLFQISLQRNTSGLKKSKTEEEERHYLNYISNAINRSNEKKINNIVSTVERARQLKIWVGTFNMAFKDFPINEDNITDLSKFIPQGYDIYALGVQEAINENIFLAMQNLFRSRNQNQMRVPFFDKVIGRGDGAFVFPKFTGLCIYADKNLMNQDFIRYIKSAAIPLGISQGSKGAVVCLLMIYGLTFLFISTHMPAKNNAQRLQAFQFLSENIPKEVANKKFDLIGQFHQIIWCGDLNYRVSGIKIKESIEKLKKRQLTELFKNFDQLIQDRLENNAFYDFEEPIMGPNFYPTYKKVEPRQNYKKDDPLWVDFTFRTEYRQPWYKSGKLKIALPGWCDRVLYHVSPNCKAIFYPEQIKDKGEVDQFYKEKKSQVYYDFTDGLNFSDHSPVAAGFILDLPNYKDFKELLMSNNKKDDYDNCIWSLSISDVRVQRGLNKFLTPSRIQLLFPILHENEESQHINTTYNKLELFYIGDKPINCLQCLLSVQVAEEAQRLHTYFCLNDEEIFNHFGKELSCVATDHGLPVVEKKFEVKLVFKVKISLAEKPKEEEQADKRRPSNNNFSVSRIRTQSDVKFFKTRVSTDFGKNLNNASNSPGGNFSHFRKPNKDSPVRSNESSIERRGSLTGEGAKKSIRRSESKDSDGSGKSHKQVRFVLPKDPLNQVNSEADEDMTDSKKITENQEMILSEDEEERNNGTKKGVKELSCVGVSFRKK